MKKYIIPTIEVIALDTEESTLTTTSNLGVDNSTEVGSGYAPSRRRSDDWSDFEGR
jgi:hypothetical protein